MSNTSTKAVYVTKFSGASIIQLDIFKYIGGINKKVIPSLSIDEEIILWGNAMVLSGVTYHEGQQSDCRHYTSHQEFIWITHGFPLVTKSSKAKEVSV